MKQPYACVVRITNAQGETQGTGFLVSTDGLIVTCAHVVEGTEPCVAFPDGKPHPAQVVATDKVHDVAIVRLKGELPDEAEPVRLGCSSGAYDRGFRSRGYRPLGGLEGIPAKGEVLNAVSEAPGYPGVCHMPLVLQTQHVRGGMSGAPVYVPDLDLTVGMITGYWDSLKAGTGFADRDTALATPAEAITALCPDIRLWEPSPELSRSPLDVPFQAPSVPRYFVPRPEVSNELKSHLLADEPIAPGALVVSAVHGLGGIGKTTLAAALAHDSELQARFPNGILWATLGHQPEVLSRLHEWIQALGDYNVHPTTVDGASAHLRTLLHDKACLLVVDDAWQADHVRSFLVGGDRCRVLLTTRDATLARKVGARLYDLDVMTAAQALDLFEARLGSLDRNRDQAAALARELGYLPLALELAAAQVEAGISWLELLDTFRQELTDLAALDLDEATYRNESLRLSFRLSLEQLSLDDQEAFAWLGVLPEDARLNPAMAATLWDQPEVDARQRLRRLRDKGLLKLVGDDRYTVHDLLHDEAKLRLVERIPLLEAHAALLERYRKRIQNDLWHTLPDDGYIHERLTWHMEQTGQPEAIHALLREETAEGRNGWYEARDRLGQTAGYLDDVVRAWQLAEEEYTAHHSQFAIGLQCRYALITASLSSLAKNIPPELLVALVEEGMWPQSQGLAYACQMPDPAQRARALAGLAPHISGPLLQEALATAQGIQNEQLRTEVMAELIPRMAESGFPHEALAELWELPEENEESNPQAEVLGKLAPCLPELLLEKALEKVYQSDNEYYRVAALISLIPHLPERLHREALSEALAKMPVIGNEYYRVKQMARLALHQPKPQREELLQEALVAARAIWGPVTRVEALAKIAPHLPVSLQEDVLREALETVRAISNDYDQPWALAKIAPYLPESLLREALTIARAMLAVGRNKSPRSRALAWLVPRLAELGFPHEALEETKKLHEWDWSKNRRAEALVSIAPYLPESELWEAFVAARQISDSPWRAWTLVNLALHLPDELQVQARLEALGAAREIHDNQLRARTLVSLTPHLPDELQVQTLLEALEAAKVIQDEASRAHALVVLFPYLSEPSRKEVLQETMTVVLAIPSAGERLDVLTELSLHLSKSQKVGILWHALEAVRTIYDGQQQRKALSKIGPHLPKPLLGEALEVARTIQDEGSRAHALAGLTPYLSGSVREEVLHETLAAARSIQGAYGRMYRLAEMLSELAPHLPEVLLQDVLAMVREIENADDRAEVLVGLAPHLTEPLLRETLVVAWEIRDEKSRVKALVGLASHLSELLLQEALATAREIKDEDNRGVVLAELTPHLPEPERTEALQEALVAVRAIGAEWSRAEALARLAPHLPEPERTEALQEALATARVINEESQVKVLVGLAPHLPEPLLWEALAAARNIREESSRSDALAGLASHLPEMLLCEALATAREFEQTWSRAKVLDGLAPHLALLPAASLAHPWQETLHTLVARCRKDLLSDFCALAPVIERLGGEEAIAETFRAIQDVGCWWP